MAINCISTTFSPAVFGVEILGIDANIVTNLTTSIPSWARMIQPSIEVDNASFCNVTVTYTHPGQYDEVHVEAWLPLDNYNGRLHAFGGGGWEAGRNYISLPMMTGAVAEGFAAVTTDAGLVGGPTAPWGLLSDGNSNLYGLRNLGSVSLKEKAVIGKSVIESFYGEPPKYSYYTGCSQGGRQGLMLAQRYPEAYDGITAGAPATGWTHLFPGLYWPTQAINNAGGTVPHWCEFQALTAAAIEQCDPLDGVIDGIVYNTQDCLASLDPSTMIGKSYECTGGAGNISEQAVDAAFSIWHGYHTANGERRYFGLPPSSDLTSTGPHVLPFMPSAVWVDCASNGTCVNGVNGLALPWYKYYILEDSQADVTKFDHAEFDDYSRQGIQEYASLIETDDADLSKFKQAGGKMITFHGLDDHLIPSESTKAYYDRVTEFDSSVQDYYRYYEVPGLSHCFGGPSENPTELFQILRDWVENTTEPASSNIKVNALHGDVHDRIICPYPQKARLSQCDDPADAACWKCS